MILTVASAFLVGVPLNPLLEGVSGVLQDEDVEDVVEVLLLDNETMNLWLFS